MFSMEVDELLAIGQGYNADDKKQVDKMII